MLTYNEYLELARLFKRVQHLYLEMLQDRKEPKSNSLIIKGHKGYMKHLSEAKSTAEDLFIRDYPEQADTHTFYGPTTPENRGKTSYAI